MTKGKAAAHKGQGGKNGAVGKPAQGEDAPQFGQALDLRLQEAAGSAWMAP